uniref:Ig-like domain-containing protein n=1 Tax=Crocodylus porosus TaxID=8502 RepID=A0A7M4FWL3_CROPO
IEVPTGGLGMAAEALLVIQDPPRSQIRPGDSVSMSCHIDIEAQEWSRLRLEWKRRDLPTALCTLILLPSNPNHSCNPPFNLTWQWPQVTLHLGNATEQDTGVYECSVNVEIPNLLSATGNGTALNVSGEGPRGLGAQGAGLGLGVGGVQTDPPPQRGQARRGEGGLASSCERCCNHSASSSGTSSSFSFRALLSTPSPTHLQYHPQAPHASPTAPTAPGSHVPSPSHQGTN